MFDPGVDRALVAATELINTDESLKSARRLPDRLKTVEDLQVFVQGQAPELEWPDAGADQQDLEAIRRLRATLRTVWEARPVREDGDLELVNGLLDGVGTKLVRAEGDGEGGFREAAVPASSRLHDVVTATVASALAHLVVADETIRLGICRGDDCEAAIVDLTRNRSKLFCEYGNCANRTHVRAYRARQAAANRRADNAGNKPGASVRAAKPSAAQKAEQLSRPTSVSAVAAKTFRDRMRGELMQTRERSSGPPGAEGAAAN